MIPVPAGAEKNIKSVMENNIEKRQISVAIAFIKDDKGNILLQRRVDSLIPEADQKWELPGGRIEYGEDPKDAVTRECLEEIGCKIELVRLLPSVQSSVWKRADGREQHVVVICYEAKIVEGNPVPSDPKVSEIRYFSEDEIGQLDLLRGVDEYINLAKE